MASIILAAAGTAIGGSVGAARSSASRLRRSAGPSARSPAPRSTPGSSLRWPRRSGSPASGFDTLQITASSEGAALPRVFGRARVAGQLIWSSRFLEPVTTHQDVGGKGGGGRRHRVREYSYFGSLAIALCEGEVSRIGRIWADGQVDRPARPDLPAASGRRGPAARPADRGDRGRGAGLSRHRLCGLREPRLRRTATAFRSSTSRCSGRPRRLPGVPRSPALDVRGVALVPGTGEYALATEPVHFRRGKGDRRRC